MKITLLKKILIILLAITFSIPVFVTQKVRAQGTADTQFIQVQVSESSIAVPVEEGEKEEEKSLLWLMIILSILFIVLCFVVFIVLDYKLKKCRDTQAGLSVGAFTVLATTYPTSHLVGVVVLILLNILAVTALGLVIKHDFFPKGKSGKKKDE